MTETPFQREMRHEGIEPDFDKSTVMPAVNDTVIVGRGNPVNPPQYRVARIDEVNNQALIEPLDESDTRAPWWIRIESLVIIPTGNAVTLAELMARMDVQDHERDAVIAWTGDPIGTTWTEAEAADLLEAWEADLRRIRENG